ncbi:TFIIB-type zinc ribbon-containing protein [Leucobacter sp. OH1287]|uniref:TFIIB-type zinc ribbon-containing protein n=1 Tax=Leucobacter sp. OH1287 TaxID=2491049 RepID=UPI000F602B55|nr:TFIIB-type zinc ribbon-containing protein [Leucobacter sp. OH1287]RRD60147.1 TFIIB-type zinc ribbon-containing protein [Leucobacter sp. OH1287]
MDSPQNPQPAQVPEQAAAESQPVTQAPAQPAAQTTAPAQPVQQVQPAAPAQQVQEQPVQPAGHNGLNRCPKCGSTEIQPVPATANLICMFCRYQWEEQQLETDQPDPESLFDLTGTHVSHGSSNIAPDSADIITLKCGGCGSEIVIDTANALHARCHWCRNTLTLNAQIPNGAVPDAVLPFYLTHEQAVAAVSKFASKRRLFANRRFIKEFKPENVLGVYLPYLVIDSNSSAELWGYGEHLIRKYTVKRGDDTETRYDADVYQVYRQIDFTTDDLTIESSSQRADFNSPVNTNNIINTILPFDTENAVVFNANYLRGFTSEKRDQDVSAVQPQLEHQLLSIARAKTNSTLSFYNRGVRWEHEKLQLHGTKWVSMHLPVWLYSYYERKSSHSVVHYIAVNGRTGETMGSVPVSYPRLLTAALLSGSIVEAIAIMVALL